MVEMNQIIAEYNSIEFEIKNENNSMKNFLSIYLVI